MRLPSTTRDRTDDDVRNSGTVGLTYTMPKLQGNLPRRDISIRGLVWRGSWRRNAQVRSISAEAFDRKELDAVAGGGSRGQIPAQPIGQRQPGRDPPGVLRIKTEVVDENVGMPRGINFSFEHQIR